MKVNLGVWGKLSRVLMVMVVLAILAVAVLFGFEKSLPLIEQNQRLRQRIFELDTQIQQQKKLDRQLRASIEAVQSDPRTLERLAREKLGWARTNETIIRFESPRR